MKKEIFISYRRIDNQHGFVDHLVERLRLRGFSVFIDHDDFDCQGSFPKQLRDAVSTAYCFVPVLSKSYLDFDSSKIKQSWCFFEAETAFQNKVPVVPLQMEDFTAGRWYRDTDPRTSPGYVSDTLDARKALVGYYLCTQEASTYPQPDDWFGRLENLICDRFCDSSQVDTFQKFLKSQQDPAMIRLYGQQNQIEDSGTLYIPLYAHRHYPQKELAHIEEHNNNLSTDEAKLSAEPQLVPPDEFLQIILLERFTLITGEAGQGKTVLAKSLQQKLSNDCLDAGLNRKKPFPVLVKCQDIIRVHNASEDKNFVACLPAAIGLPLFAFDTLLEKGQPFIVLDGLDEVDLSAGKFILDGVKNLLNYRNAVHVCITSRPRGLASARLTAGEEEAVRYELCTLDGPQFSTLTSSLFQHIAEHSTRPELKQMVTADGILEAYQAAVLEREAAVPHYQQISRVPFYAYPLVIYYLQYNGLPESSTALLDFFTTDILRRELCRTADHSFTPEFMKRALGAVALSAYQSRAQNRLENFDLEHCSLLSSLLQQLFPLASQQLLLGNFRDCMRHSPYFAEAAGFSHEVYSAYSAAVYWWEDSRDFEVLKSLLCGGPACEAAVESILYYADLHSADPDFLPNLIDNLQHSTETPPYDLLCRTANSFIHCRDECQKRLLRHMFRRGIQGICTYNADTNTCTSGANPYEELFYYAVSYSYEDIISDYQPQAQTEQEPFIETVLLSDLHIIFEMDPIAVDSSQPLYRTMRAAASWKRRSSVLKGHVIFDIDAIEPCPDSLGGKALTEAMIEKFSLTTSITIRSWNVRYNCPFGVGYSTIPFIHCLQLKILRILHPGLQIDVLSFSYCEQLAAVTFPPKAAISPSAFSGCTGIETITIPESLLPQISQVCSDALNLQCIRVITDSGEFSITANEHRCFVDPISKALLYARSGAEIPDDGSVTCIRSRAFSHSGKISAIRIPQCIVQIEDDLFYKTQVEELTISSVWITELSRIAGHLELIKKIHVLDPHGDYSIQWSEDGTLIDPLRKLLLRGTKAIPADGRVNAIGSQAFYYAYFSCLKIPDCINELHCKAFYNCRMSGIYIPDSVTKIANDAFTLLGSCEQIRLPHSFLQDTQRIFSPHSITNRTLVHDRPENIWRTKDGSLWDLDKGTLLQAPAKEDSAAGTCLQKLGEDYFDSLFTTLVIPDTVTSLSKHTFRKCHELESITLSDSALPLLGILFSNCSLLHTIRLTHNGTVRELHRESGNFFRHPDRDSILLGFCSTVIPDDGSITAIEPHAFQNCRELKTIEIPSSIQSIGDYAFANCTSLQKVSLQLSLDVHTVLNQKDSSHIFSGCNRLTEAEVWGALSSVWNIFLSSCPKLERVQIVDPIFDDSDSELSLDDNFCFLTKEGWLVRGDERTVIPADGTVRVISRCAFRGCHKLKSIRIPGSVRLIGPLAFDDCTQLASVTYEGTRLHWKLLPGHKQLNGRTIHCKNGDLLQK